MSCTAFSRDMSSGPKQICSPKTGIVSEEIIRMCFSQTIFSYVISVVSFSYHNSQWQIPMFLPRVF